MDLLDFIRSAYPEVYERTRYNTVEIGGRLAKLKEELSDHTAHGMIPASVSLTRVSFIGIGET